MRRLGAKTMRIDLREPVEAVPPTLAPYGLERAPDGLSLTYRYDARAERTGITSLLNDLRDAGLALRDVHTSQRSLEEIFVDLVRGRP